MDSPPLVVDLDGTLIQSDLLLESALPFIRMKPLSPYLPFKWLISGKAHLKEQLANAVSIDVTSLPYNSKVIEFIKEEKKKGRQIILATASHKIYAEQIAKYLNLFDRVVATDGKNNLSGCNKRDALIENYGKHGFDYVGNSRDDLPVWAAARKSYLVNTNSKIESKARSQGNVERVISSNAFSWKAWTKALRLHQWMKNILIFVPVLASHQLSNGSLFLKSLFAFFIFCLCASSVYLLNDLLDLNDDRHHPTKRYRSFASGQLSIKAGLIAFSILFIFSFFNAILLLPWKFSVALGAYFGVTLIYSFVLKRKMAADVIALALLYTLRIVSGVFVCGLVLTFWILAFSVFIFLSLALVKRYAELFREAQINEKMEKTRGRGYCPGDLEMISSLGAASGYLSVLVLALYVQDPNTITLYKHPKFIWLSCPLILYWITRIWLLAHRGLMHEDPIVFAIKDRISLLTAALLGVIFWSAI